MIRQIREDSISEVKRLLLPENIPPGFNINSLDPQGQSFLHHAVLRSRLAIASELIAAGADVNRAKEGLAAAFAGIYPIFDSAVMGDLPMIQLLIENGAHIELRSQGVTPFLAAVQGTHLMMIAYLINIAGANYQVLNGNGRNALDMLREALRVRQGREDIGELLDCASFLMGKGLRYAIGVEEAAAPAAGAGAEAAAEAEVRLIPLPRDFGMTDGEFVTRIQTVMERVASTISLPRMPAVKLIFQRAREARAAREAAAAGAAPAGGRRRKGKSKSKKTHRRRGRGQKHKTRRRRF